jgi:hypothetical protein
MTKTLTPYQEGFLSGAGGEVYCNPYPAPSAEHTAFYGGWNGGQAAGLGGY